MKEKWQKIKRNIVWCSILIIAISILVFERKNRIDIAYLLFLISVLSRYLIKTNV